MIMTHQYFPLLLCRFRASIFFRFGPNSGCCFRIGHVVQTLRNRVHATLDAAGHNGDVRVGPIAAANRRRLIVVGVYRAGQPLGFRLRNGPPTRRQVELVADERENNGVLHVSVRMCGNGQRCGGVEFQLNVSSWDCERFVPMPLGNM